MSLGERMTAASNRFFGRVRHPQALQAAAQPGTAAGLEAFARAKYALLTTFRRDGTPVPTPVWFGIADGKLYARSEASVGKVKRIRADAHARVAPCTVRGKPLGPATEATARVLDDAEAQHAEAALQANYGLGRRIYESGGERLGIDTVYLEIVPTSPGEAP